MHYRSGTGGTLLHTHRQTRCVMPKVHQTRFPVTSSEKFPTCCGRVSGTTNYMHLDMSSFASKSATSWQQVIIMEFEKDTMQRTQRTFARADFNDLLRTCYGETGVMDFGLYQAHQQLNKLVVLLLLSLYSAANTLANDCRRLM